MRKFFSAFSLALFFVWSLSGAEQSPLPDFISLVKREGPAVVNISTTRTVRGEEADSAELDQNDPFYEFFRRFLPPPSGSREFQARTLGSGFFISEDGYILTNAHVVAGTDEVIVKLTDKREFKAKIVGVDLRTDVALIKIAAKGLPKIPIGDPNKLEVGEWVAAIGAPFGFENSVTQGIVSAKGRLFPEDNYVPFIQTDVAVNPGNSGGPLFNLRGEVVGVNSVIYSRTGGFMGLSFAIPIDLAMEISEQLRAHGKVIRGRLGVQVQELTQELAASFGLKATTGALVALVEKNAPADRAGIVPGDVILKFDNKVIENSGDLPRLVAATKPGTKVRIEVWRRGTPKELTVTIGELTAERTAELKERPEPKANRLGLALSELTAQQRDKLGIERGLMVRNASGLAAKVGIRRGDVILAVNDKEIATVEEFNTLMSEIGPGRTMALLVLRGNSVLYLPLRVPE
jgi:serine protease Do